jgi:hypothetical protein
MTTNPAQDEKAFSKLPKIKPNQQRQFLQTMGNLDSNKINSTTENFIRNQHGMHIPAEKIHTSVMNKRPKDISPLD